MRKRRKTRHSNGDLDVGPLAREEQEIIEAEEMNNLMEAAQEAELMTQEER